MEALQTQLKLEQRNKRKAVRCERLLLPHLPLQLDHKFSADRPVIEHYISARFYESYQAEITSFLPYLLSTHNDNKLSAALGFQPANETSPLFLETYLDDEIQVVISAMTGQIVARDKIAEIGNLTSSRRGSSQMLFILIAAILHEAGFDWVVFTATKQVQQILDKLNLHTIQLCEADPRRLADHGQSWGSYYNNNPKVLAGNLAYAMVLLQQHKVIGFMLQNYRNTIVELAGQIKH